MSGRGCSVPVNHIFDLRGHTLVRTVRANRKATVECEIFTPCSRSLAATMAV